MRLINEDDALEIIERVTNEAVEKKQPKYLIQPRIIAEISGLPTIEAEPDKGWISVKDRPPEDDVDVLLHDKYCGTLIGWYDKKDDVFKTDYISQLEAVTRWMPLPEDPKEE